MLDDDEKTEAKSDPLHEARERYAEGMAAWKDDRRRYVADLKFVDDLDQWPEDMRRKREEQGLPCLVVDKLNQYVRQVVNDSRQNRQAIKVRPVDDDADPETAEVFQGIIKHIEDDSASDAVYDTAQECAVKGGFGFIRVATEYDGEDTYNQKICLRRVRNPLAVTLDQSCQEADGSDAKWAFIDLPAMSSDEFEAKYPKAKKVSWDADEGTVADYSGKDDPIRICEYFWVEEKPRTLHLLDDGTSATDEEIALAKSEGVAPPKIVQSREITTKTVKWATISGKEYLEGPQEWPGKYIPVVPVWGNESDIEGKICHTGMIFPAKDAARIYNYSRTKFIERVALTPESPWLVPTEGTAQYNEWESGATSRSAMRYDAYDAEGNPLPSPRREPAADLPSGFAEDMQLSEHDIQAALGMYSSSLGRESDVKSGRALLAQQKQGSVATYHYADNLSRALRHVGRILVDLIPKIYDTKRTVRMLGEDGSHTMARLDPSLSSAAMKRGKQTIYNVGVGRYDVSVSTGPSYSTRRQEAAESMIAMSQANPAIWQTHGDLIAKSQDWPMADEFAARFKALLPPGLANTGEDGEEQSPEVMAITQQAQQAIAERDQALHDAAAQMQALQQQITQMQAAIDSKMADYQIKQAEIELKSREVEIKSQEVAIKAQEAEIKAAETAIKNKDADTKVYSAETDRMGMAISAEAAQSSTPEPVDMQQIIDKISAALQQMHDIAAQAIQSRPVQVRAIRGADGYNIESIDGAGRIKTATATKSGDGSIILTHEV